MGYEGLLSIYSRMWWCRWEAEKDPPLFQRSEGLFSDNISGPFKVFQGRLNRLWKWHWLGNIGNAGETNRMKRPGLSWEEGAHRL